MEDLSYPRLPGAQNADFTRPLDPSTPSIGDRRLKRAQVGHNHAPEPVPYGGTTRRTTTAAAALREGIEASIAEATRTAEILQDFAKRTDAFASGYKTQKDQQIAEAISKAVARSLVAFYQASFAPTRTTTPPPAYHAPKNASYASMAKASNKKPQNSEGQPTKNPLPKPAQRSRADHRILVTMHSTVLLKGREEAFILRRRLVERIEGLSLAQIPVISPTKSGWALLPADLASRDLLLAEANQPVVLEALGGFKMSIPEVWYDYAVPSIPSAFRGIDGEVRVDQDLVLDEAFNQTGETPVRCDISRHGASAVTGKATWVVSFKKKVKPFHLFNTWSQARLIEKKPRITRHAIGGCQGWCNPVKCTKAPLCGNCGDKMEGHDGPSGENCQHKAKCANCHGPHKASHDNCPAKPRTNNGSIIRPTKTELRNIRQAGRLAALAAAGRVPARSTSTPPASAEGTDPNAHGTQTSLSSSPSLSPSPSPSSQLQGAKRNLKGHRIHEYENASINSARASSSTPSSRVTSNATTSSGRPARTTVNQQSLNLRELSKKSLQGNAFALLGEPTTTSQTPDLSDDDMDDSDL